MSSNMGQVKHLIKVGENCKKAGLVAVPATAKQFGFLLTQE